MGYRIRQFLSDSKRLFFCYLFRLIPVNDKWIVFDNFNGRGYGDNPKYICNRLHKEDPTLKMFWLVANKNEVSLPNFVIPINIYSTKAIYILSRSRVIVNNVKNLLPFFKKSSQFYIQTWHGVLALKYIEQEVEGNLSPIYIKESKKETSITDVCLVGGEADYKIFENHFWGEKELLKCGSPRNDVFFEDNTIKISTIKKKLGLDSSCKVLLYAPTFRDDNSISGYNVDLDLLLETLNSLTSDRWTILVRMHPNVANVCDLFDFSESVINVSNYADPQDLSIVSDVLITDYSSICLDFMLQKKPVFLYISDYEDYKRNSRPLRYIFEELPSQKSYTNIELIDSIRKFKYEDYNLKREFFLKNIFKSYDDGSATKQIVDRILNVINSNVKSDNVY